MARVTFTFVFLLGVFPFILNSKVASEQGTKKRIHKRAPGDLLNPPIPTSIALYTGGNDLSLDSCPRDKVEMPDGNCYRLLTRGPCSITEHIILDPLTMKPFCAQRLCAPDRVFIYSDQKCHDPRSLELCPAGRQLYATAFGTPICQCPTGTYEGDDDYDDDVCEPLLGQTMANTCPPGEVFWFKDFKRLPECVPDPCSGKNLNKDPSELPFVPFKDGRCFQVGTMPEVCPAYTWYTIALSKLQGVCSSLEDAGYETFDQFTLKELINIYGPPIPRDNTSPIRTIPSAPGTNGASVLGGPAFQPNFVDPINTLGINTVGGDQGSVIRGPSTGISDGFGPGSVTFGSGVDSQGISLGSSGISGHGVTSGNQGAITIGQLSLDHRPGSVSLGSSSQGSFGISRQPASPFFSHGGQTLQSQERPGHIIPSGQSPSLVTDNQSLEQFGIYDDDGSIFRTDSLDDFGGSVDGDLSNLMIREGQLLADVISDGRFDNIKTLRAPPGHELYGFFNSVRTLINNGPHVRRSHRRSRRTPLPFAAPGNVFEPSLVGCRAGVERDVNVKCRDV
ncbi:hypothetical protein SK128_016386 [Halocaridina rubra]|uniref:DUF4789 domain-containing protein n=1 Tax=Halocaridina rubra TaxID=373956 RepID=A0AAN9ACZ0_HALRR